MKKRILFFSLIFTSLLTAQEKTEVLQDSLKLNALDEVVVTGQINRQSVKKSVFEVKVITRADIERQAGNNLSDLLNQNLNMQIIPSASTGKSQVQLFGLDGQYFKILVDNIPLINDEGLGNNTDLTQINLDDIEQIEIVEGSMGVQYGSNAVSGIINIITKKSSKHRWEIVPYIQEETVGNEYNLEDKGRHIQSIKIGHNFSDKLYANAVYTRNDFMGYFNGRKGKDYPENDGLRGYEWLPKEQQNIKALLNYRLEKIQFHFKSEYFDENVSRYDAVVNPNYNPATQTTNPTATDEIFTSTRLFNHLNVFGAIKNRINYDVSLSYQQQKRNIETFTYRINFGNKENVNEQEYESRQGFYSRGNFNNFITSEKFNFQLGYELSVIDGFASTLSGQYSEKVERKMESYDAFVSAEYLPSEKWSFQPGVRVLFSPQFKPLAALSLSSKYQFNNGMEARAIIGTSPRTPSYDELYTYFVDVNHDVRGNENLISERGYSAFLHLKKSFWFDDNTQWSPKLSGWYLSVEDRIELMIINNLPLQYRFENIDQFKSWGVSTTQTLKHKNIQVNIGGSFSGVSKVLDSAENLYDDDYLYSFQANSNLSYTFPKWNTIFSVFYKYNGPVYQFVQRQNENNETIIIRGKQDSYSWMDASAKKSFFNKKFEITLGARNILNINRIDTTATEGGAHNAAPSNILLGYGRSYFIKLLYNLNF